MGTFLKRKEPSASTEVDGRHPTGEPVREIVRSEFWRGPTTRPLTCTPALQSNTGTTTPSTSASTTLTINDDELGAFEVTRYSPGETRENSNRPSRPALV